MTAWHNNKMVSALTSHAYIAWTIANFHKHFHQASQLFHSSRPPHVWTCVRARVCVCARLCGTWTHFADGYPRVVCDACANRRSEAPGVYAIYGSGWMGVCIFISHSSSWCDCCDWMCSITCTDALTCTHNGSLGVSKLHLWTCDVAIWIDTKSINTGGCETLADLILFYNDIRIGNIHTERMHPIVIDWSWWKEIYYVMRHCWYAMCLAIFLPKHSYQSFLLAIDLCKYAHVPG